MAHAGYDQVSVGEKCVTSVMYGLHFRVALTPRMCKVGSIDPPQQAAAIAAVLLAEEHSGELRRMISS
jgi:hypothetical protein